VLPHQKKDRRLRRAAKTRKQISIQSLIRLSVFRSNLHIYASLISEDGSRIIAAASTLEDTVRNILKTDGCRSGNVAAAVLVGKRIAEKAKQLGVNKIAFDRSGFAYHGRVKALAESAREAGLQF
jgi:large subunit ribosomal protein L18